MIILEFIFLSTNQMKDFCPEDKVSIMIIFFVIFSALYVFMTIFNTKNLENINYTKDSKYKKNNIIFPDEHTVYRDINGYTIKNEMYISGIIFMIITILYTMYILYSYKFTKLSTFVFLLSAFYLLSYGIIIIHFQDPSQTTDDFTFLGSLCIIASVIGLYYKILDTLVCS